MLYVSVLIFAVILAPSTSQRSAVPDDLYYLARTRDVALSITVPRRIDLEQPLWVKAEMRNSAREPIITSSNNRVYRTLELETADGKAVQLTDVGRQLSSRVQDVHDGSIRAGEGASVSINLKELYEIRQPGVYKFSIRQTFLLANSKDARALSIENVRIIVGDDLDVFSPD